MEVNNSMVILTIFILNCKMFSSYLFVQYGFALLYNFNLTNFYRIVNLQEDMRLQKKNLKRMSDRIVELERTQGTSRMYLEHIYHKLEQQGQPLF